MPLTLAGNYRLRPGGNITSKWQENRPLKATNREGFSAIHGSSGKCFAPDLYARVSTNDQQIIPIGGGPAFPRDVDCGTEIRLFDPRRNPRDWADLIRPTECAVFLKNRTASASLAPDGQPYPKSADITRVVFDRLDAAQRFCEAKVRALPHLRCEIYDAQGLARPPLLVIIHPDLQRKRILAPFGRTAGNFLPVLSIISAPFFWIGMRQSSSSDLATFLAFNCTLSRCVSFIGILV